MYAKLGKFKPGDVIKPLNAVDNTFNLKIISIKKRKNGNHLYKLKGFSNTTLLWIPVNSLQISYIDSRYKLTLKKLLKNL
jgi:hypothetical protein